MSKERAQARAERERQAAAAAAARARSAGRERRRRARAAKARAAVPRRSSRPSGVLAQRRRAQNSIIALLFVVAQVLTWLVFQRPQISFAVAAFSVLAVPVLVTLALDRRR